MKTKRRFKNLFTKAMVRLTGGRSSKKAKSVLFKDGFDIIQEVDAIEDAAYYFPRS